MYVRFFSYSGTAGSRVNLAGTVLKRPASDHWPICVRKGGILNKLFDGSIDSMIRRTYLDDVAVDGHLDDVEREILSSAVVTEFQMTR